MSGANVHDQIASTKPSLVEMMTSNQDVSAVVMAYLNLLVGLSLKKDVPIDGISISNGHIESNSGTDKRSGEKWMAVYVASVRFSRISAPMAKIWGTQSDFYNYAKAKASHMAQALDVNPNLEKFFYEMVETIDNWARQKGIPFSHVSIRDAIVTRDYSTLTFKIGRRSDIV